jgi:hypothetical protein
MGQFAKLKFIGTKRRASANANSRLNAIWTDAMAHHTFVVCVSNEAYSASLELRKLYELLADDEAAKHGQVRIIDESGEDYLYPKTCFAPVEVPLRTEKLILRAA